MAVLKGTVLMENMISDWVEWDKPPFQTMVVTHCAGLEARKDP